MFIRIIKKFDGSVEVWLMKDSDNGMRLFYFRDIFEGDAVETIKDFIALMSAFQVVCHEQTLITTLTDLDSILEPIE